jgi:hypothetical protein
MSNFSPDKNMLQALKNSTCVSAFAYYNSEKTVDSNLFGSHQKFLEACRGVQQIAANIGKALNTSLQEIEFEGLEDTGDRGIIRRYNAHQKRQELSSSLVVITEQSLDELRDELNIIEKIDSADNQPTGKRRYRGNLY